MQFTAEHEAFRKTIRDFVEREINPYCDEWEAAGIFPAHELFPKLAALGAFGLEFDTEYGGQGADATFTLVLGEELGRADCAGVPLSIAVQVGMATPALARFGTDELKAKYLAPQWQGKWSLRLRSPSRTRAPTSPGSGPRPPAMGTTGSSTAERCGSPTAPRQTGSAFWPGPLTRGATQACR